VAFVKFATLLDRHSGQAATGNARVGAGLKPAPTISAFADMRRGHDRFFWPWAFTSMYCKFAWTGAGKYNKKARRGHPARLCKTLLRNLVLVGQHSFISAAAVLINDPLTGLVVDLVALPAGLSDVFRRCFVTVTEENHRFVVRI
jgi:hypothetical protein